MIDTKFISGLELSRLFYQEVVAKQIAEGFPSLRYGAALLGGGSQVLGFDTAMSSDHGWGPRILIFLTPEDFSLIAPQILERLEDHVPNIFRGVPVNFDDLDRQVGLDLENYAAGSTEHRIEIFTVESFIKHYVDIDIISDISPLTWLELPEQILLSLTSGAIFRDDSGALTAAQQKLAYYPKDIWLYLLASQWSRIAEERAFVGRSGEAGDEVGSAVIAARLVKDLMQLCFLMERRYAPYAKWFGTAFARLQCATELSPALRAVLHAESWKKREQAMSACYEKVGRMHTERSIPGTVQPCIANYYTRPFQVLNTDDFVAAIQAHIEDPVVKALPLYGSIDQISDNTQILANSDRSSVIVRALHEHSLVLEEKHT